MTIFINYRVFDFKGNFIGATGVGLKVDNVRILIDAYEKRFDREIYFLDHQGNVVLTGSAHRGKKGNIREWEGLRDQAATILSKNTVPQQLEYRQQGALILLNTRFIPELGWYLVVEQNESSATLTQRRIEKMATTDHLTGLSNRQGLALLFDHAMKQVARWGGEEFLVVMMPCDLAQALQVGEKIRAAIEASAYRENDLCLPLSVSVGVTQYQQGESLDALLARADRALYSAKQLGRNRVESLLQDSYELAGQA